MGATTRIADWAGARVSKRISRTLPLLGTAIALITLGATMRKKGVFRGTVDTGLNAIPFLGAAKTVAELVRGRDFIPDRR